MNLPQEIKPEELLFFFCDIQEKLRGKTPHFDRTVHVACHLLKLAKMENYPFHIVIINPGQTGQLVNEIQSLLTPEEQSKVHTKEVPSMLDKQGLSFLQQHPQKKKVVLCGFETHVCIAQTCRDLKALGYEVYVMIDAVESQRWEDQTAGFKRIEKYGCNIYSFEGLFMEIYGADLHNVIQNKQQVMGLTYECRQIYRKEKNLKIQIENTNPRL